jgi:hypothetical protein
MSDTQHGRRRRVSLARLDETVVENAIRQRDAAQIDVANARAHARGRAGAHRKRPDIEA